MTKRELQQLVKRNPYATFFCAVEDRHGNQLGEPTVWRLRDDADRRMFVEHANRHLVWFACDNEPDEEEREI